MRTILILMMGLSLSLSPASLAYDLTISHSEARDTLLEMLKDPALNSGDSRAADPLKQLIRSYRNHSVPGTPSVQEGPFVGFVLQNQIVSSWPDLYDSQYKDQYDEYVTNITYEGLFDILMQAIEHHQLPAEIKDVGDEIGECLARKVEDADTKTCKLDNSDGIPAKPSLLHLGWMKYTCGVPVLSQMTSPCSARQTIFAVAKPALMKAKKEGLMAKVFPIIFPQIFRGNIVDGVNEKRADIAPFVSHKFNAGTDGLWNAPLVDVEDSGNRVTGLREVSTGLAADIRAASVLQNTAPEIAAPLFYAAANRLIALMGGVQAHWDGHEFQSQDGDHLDPANPKAPPKFVTESFGGASVKFSGKPGAQTEVAAPWDIANYDPTPAKDPSPMQLFPSRFIIGDRAMIAPLDGQKTVESMIDLGELLNALVDFLELTSGKSALASHFTLSSNFKKIISADDPAVFPREGRTLAVGLIAAAVKNMIAPKGHVVLPDPDAPSTGVDDHSGIFGLRFYDEIDLQGKIEGKVPVTAISGVFGAAERLSQLIAAGDPDVPQSLVDLKSKLDKAVELSMYSIVGRCQQGDGGFVDHFGDPMGPRSFDTQVAVLKVLTDYYNVTHTPAIRLVIRQAWKFLERFWIDAGDVPWSQVDNSARTFSQPPSSLWKAISLWNETKSTAIYPDLMNPALDNVWGKTGWDKWQARFAALHDRLASQLDSVEGPQVIDIR